MQAFDRDRMSKLTDKLLSNTDKVDPLANKRNFHARTRQGSQDISFGIWNAKKASLRIKDC